MGSIASCKIKNEKLSVESKKRQSCENKRRWILEYQIKTSIDLKVFVMRQKIIMLVVYMKCRFSLSYRELEELAMMRGIVLDHVTCQRWIIKFVSFIEEKVRRRKKPVGKSWRMDETYIKAQGKWVYLYRAVDKYGNTIDFLLKEYRDEKAAKAFFKKSINLKR